MTVVLFEKKGKIAYVTINRPEAMNALDNEVQEGLTKAWRDLDSDPDLWVAILTGAGDKAFTAGADLKKVHSEPRHDDYTNLTGRNLAPSVDRTAKPVIAAINGYCLAGGLELALACDIRIASETASFGCPEVRWNLLHGYGALRLPQMVPMSMAMEMMLTGDRIDAREAYRIGLVSRVVPAAELMKTAEAIAERICENAPIAVRVTKELAYRGLHLPLDDGVRLYAALSRSVMATEDSREGPRAFAEKRTPQFKGR
jgi:E-phenylitaconyl-CoA hydratase